MEIKAGAKRQPLAGLPGGMRCRGFDAGCEPAGRGAGRAGKAAEGTAVGAEEKNVTLSVGLHGFAGLSE